VTTLHGPGAQGNSLELIQEVLSVGADGAGSFKSHARSPTATETTLQPPRSCGTEDGQVPGQYEYKTVYQAVFRSFVGPAITIARPAAVGTRWGRWLPQPLERRSNGKGGLRCSGRYLDVKRSVRRGTCPPGTHTFDIWLRSVANSIECDLATVED